MTTCRGWIVVQEITPYRAGAVSIRVPKMRMLVIDGAPLRTLRS